MITKIWYIFVEQRYVMWLSNCLGCYTRLTFLLQVQNELLQLWNPSSRSPLQAQCGVIFNSLSEPVWDNGDAGCVHLWCCNVLAPDDPPIIIVLIISLPPSSYWILSPLPPPSPVKVSSAWCNSMLTMVLDSDIAWGDISDSSAALLYFRPRFVSYNVLGFSSTASITFVSVALSLVPYKKRHSNSPISFVYKELVIFYFAPIPFFLGVQFLEAIWCKLSVKEITVKVLLTVLKTTVWRM